MTVKEFCTQNNISALTTNYEIENAEISDAWDAMLKMKAVNWLTTITTIIKPEIKNKLLEIFENMENPFSDKQKTKLLVENNFVSNSNKLKEDINKQLEECETNKSENNNELDEKRQSVDPVKEVLTECFGFVFDNNINDNKSTDKDNEILSSQNEIINNSISLTSENVNESEQIPKIKRTEVSLKIIDKIDMAEIVHLTNTSDATKGTLNLNRYVYILLTYAYKKQYFEVPIEEAAECCNELNKIFSFKYFTDCFVFPLRILRSGMNVKYTTITNINYKTLHRLATLLDYIEAKNDYMIRLLVAVKCPKIINFSNITQNHMFFSDDKAEAFVTIDDSFLVDLFGYRSRYMVQFKGVQDLVKAFIKIIKSESAIDEALFDCINLLANDYTTYYHDTIHRALAVIDRPIYNNLNFKMCLENKGNSIKFVFDDDSSKTYSVNTKQQLKLGNTLQDINAVA